MLIIDSKRLAKEKVKNIQKGYSAYAETEEVSNLIKKQLKTLNLEVHEDHTDKGCWFIPKEGPEEKQL